MEALDYELKELNTELKKLNKLVEILEAFSKSETKTIPGADAVLKWAKGKKRAVNKKIDNIINYLKEEADLLVEYLGD